jgi:hypothetical protein
MKESERIALEISALKQEAAELEARKTELMEDTSRVDARRKSLVDKFGLIDIAIRGYKTAVLEEEDDDKLYRPS